MNYYRLSKYDPLLKTEGIYQRDDWNSFGDIGEVFSGAVLQAGDYLVVEQRYQNCILEILSACQVEMLCICALELYESALPWLPNQMLFATETRNLISDGLREQCWAVLVGASFMLDFGYEYYLHIGCSLPPDIIKAIAYQHQLFVEPWKPFPMDTKLRFRLQCKSFWFWLRRLLFRSFGRGRLH